MSPRTIDELEHELHRDDSHHSGPDLTAIKAAGMHRRHLTAMATGVGVLAAMVAVGLVLSGTLGPGGSAVDPQPAGRPHELSALAKRALAEVPGAAQVSDWQVVLPAPEVQRPLASRVGHRDVVTAEVPLGASTYAEVADYPASAFPGWLRGSTDPGLLVRSGAAELGCVAERRNLPVCSPALLSDDRGTLSHEMGMAFADFNEPGAGMGVFTYDDFSSGQSAQLVFAGLHGTDVASVEMVTTTGDIIAGHVESGTVVAGQTLMWGRVPGIVARVIAYDAAGDVLEDHRVQPCEDFPRCEVR